MSTELIVRATRILAGVCDGAATLDGHGYNRFDVPFMHKMAHASAHTPRQLRAMWHTLRKYVGQLGQAGITYSDLVPPPIPPREAGSERVVVRVESGRHPQYGVQINVRFPYSPGIVAAIKTLGQRYWNPEGKFWAVPRGLDHYDALLEKLEPIADLDIEPELAAHYADLREERKRMLASSRAERSELSQVTKVPLLPFQLAGVDYLQARDGNALIGDEMGLGKTAQAIDYLVRHPEARPALVVAPATVRVNWYREVDKFSGLSRMVLASPSNVRSLAKLGVQVDTAPRQGVDIVITNYDILKANLSLLKAYGFKTLILDEAHKIKEQKAARTKVALELARTVEHTILLTGTPLLNRPKELWTLSQAIKPDLFPSFFRFAKRYCNATQGRWGWDFNGASNLDELDKLLRSEIMVRREKTQVLKELPPLRRATVPMSLNGHATEYQREAAPILEVLREARKLRAEWKAKLDAMEPKARKKYLAEHAEEVARVGRIVGVLVSEIAKLRTVAAKAKLDGAVERIEDMVEESGKVIVFTYHHEVTDLVLAKLADAEIRTVQIDGRVNVAKRQHAVDTFQGGDAQVAVIGVLAGAEGINLHIASNCVFLELPWRPGDVEQAAARAWRMGQVNPVTAWFFVALGTIEESMARMLDSKREVVNAAIGEESRTVEEEGILDAILDEVL